MLVRWLSCKQRRNPERSLKRLNSICQIKFYFSTYGFLLYIDCVQKINGAVEIAQMTQIKYLFKRQIVSTTKYYIFIREINLFGSPYNKNILHVSGTINKYNCKYIWSSNNNNCGSYMLRVLLRNSQCDIRHLDTHSISVANQSQTLFVDGTYM